MENAANNSVRMQGNGFPAYLNGRPRRMLVEAFGSPAAPVVGAADGAKVPALIADLRTAGVLGDRSAAFGSPYMVRAKKKLALYPTAA